MGMEPSSRPVFHSIFPTAHPLTLIHSSAWKVCSRQLGFPLSPVLGIWASGEQGSRKFATGKQLPNNSKNVPFGRCAEAHKRALVSACRRGQRHSKRGKGDIYMSEVNKEKARRLVEEAFGQGNVELIPEILHSDF